MSGTSAAGRGGVRYRILTVDGGGIYGLFDAIWLRQICERVEGFLDPSAGGGVDFMSGISSGAINVLLIAAADDPRQYVLSGELERFWTDESHIFDNRDPMGRYLSLLGLTAWGGERDFREILERRFGSRRLRDLRRYVSASVFNWTGDDFIDFERRAAVVMPNQQPGAPMDLLGTADLLEGHLPDYQRPGTNERLWRPRMMTNFEHDPDRDCLASDVAYAAAAPPGLRPIRGAGDAASYTGNPSVESIAAWVHEVQEHAVAEQGERGTGQKAKDVAGSPGHILDSISLLSLGNAAAPPYYWLRHFNFGMPVMMAMPTNPMLQMWMPPAVSVPLQAPILLADFVANMLLGDRYFRLAPDLLYTPVAIATMTARFDVWRRYWIRRIYEATSTPRSLHAVDMAARFLKNDWHAIP